MNLFSGNLLLEWNIAIKWLEFDYIENISKSWDKIIFIFWETELAKSSDIINLLEKKLWKFKNVDLSISTEDKIDIINDTYEEWVYELATFEWEQVDFNEIFDRFKWFEEVVSIREAEISNKFWNKVVKVDFVY